MTPKTRRRKSPRYLIGLDVVRVFSCIAVVLYHMGILQGGYLAVCTFFVLSGYLAVRSACGHKKFSLGRYFLNQLLHIYVPLVIVTLITVAVVTRLEDIHWLNMKPETTSVLLGYNNIWQYLNSQDYFAAHSVSPFVHFWYISLQLQFSVVFPFVFMGLDALRKRFKNSAAVITGALALAALFWFFYMARTSTDLMRVYFGTDTRLFSLLFGVFAGFAEEIRPLSIPFFRTRNRSRLIIAAYLICMGVSAVLINDSSVHYTVAMTAFTLMACRCMSYSLYAGEAGRSTHYFSDLCYGIYLVQFPVIYVFSNNSFFAGMTADTVTGALGLFFVIMLEALVIIVLSAILKFGTDLISRPLPFTVWKIVPALVAAALVFGAVRGGMVYASSEDHQAEMQEIESQLAANEEELVNRQAEFLERREAAEAEYAAAVAALQEDRDHVPEAVAELPVVAIGDSVMLGSMSAFYEQFPNAYFDAEVSRPTRALQGILESLNRQDLINGPVIIALGANGDIGNERREEVLSLIEDQEVFWVTNTWLEDVNEDLFRYQLEHEHFHIIDWASYVEGHSDWLAADGLHLNRTGARNYVENIYTVLCEYYDAQFDAREAALEREHEAGYMATVSIYGNDLFVSAGDLIAEHFPDASLVYGRDYTWEELLEDLAADEAEDGMGYNVVLGFDAQQPPDADILQRLMTLLSEHAVYICAVDDASYTLLSQTAGVNVIDLRTAVFGQKEEVFYDGVHLNDLGNTALMNALDEALADVASAAEDAGQAAIPDDAGGAEEGSEGAQAETVPEDAQPETASEPAAETEPAGGDESAQPETVIAPVRNGVNG